MQAIQAVGIPQISSDVFTTNLSQIAQALGIPVDSFDRRVGPIDLLIGINYPRFHVGETKMKNTLAARKSTLGWVVFGSNAEGVVPEIKKVLHIRVETPVDLTEFWKTESMGVSVSPCTCEAAKMSTEERAELQHIEESCQLEGNKWVMKYPWKRNPLDLPNNYSQVLKKLQATERRLQKQPEHAVFEEAVQEGGRRMARPSPLCCRRRKQHQLQLFNSSASFNGQTLNDYWHKGPDLLKNLFGVVLRFRENQVAVCGDITKMYHMISIPPIDQHVHRFLWRSFETKREPDTYVKTVLTFWRSTCPHHGHYSNAQDCGPEWSNQAKG